MSKIACVDYSEVYKVLTIVFMNGTHQCYLKVNSRNHAWEILQNLNRCDFILQKGDQNEKKYCKIS